MGVLDAVGPSSDRPLGPLSPEDAPMAFYTRRWVRPEDMNAHGTLFGGSLLRWIDDEAVVYATIQLGVTYVVTRYISEISFVSSAVLGDIVEIGLAATQFGRTSLTMRAEVRNVNTARSVLTIERLVFVSMDEHGRPFPHGYTTPTDTRERLALTTSRAASPTGAEAPT